MKSKLKKRILLILLVPFACIAVWYLVGVGYLLLCELDICDFLPVEKIDIYNKDGIVVKKILSGATSQDALQVFHNDSLIHSEKLDISGDYISIQDVLITDSIRVIVQEKIPKYYDIQVDSFEIGKRTICLPK